MTTTTNQATEHFHALSETRCRELLASHHQGRIAWSSPDGPHLLPISYGLHNGKVAFRTSPYGVLAELARPAMVAFEIDDVDAEAGTGWSVLIRGRAQVVTRPFDLSVLWSLEGLVPWATGTRNLFVLVNEHSISGRIVEAPFRD